MIISKKRHTKLYSAISDPIMDLRIENNGELSTKEMNSKLFYLEREIYRRIKNVLDLHKD